MAQIKLHHRVSRQDQDEILKNLYWVDGGLEALSFDPGDEQVIHYRYAGAVEPKDLPRRLTETADRLARCIEMMPTKLVFDHDPHPPGAREPFAELVRRHWVHPVADGAHLYRGPMAQLYRDLDAEIRARLLTLPVEECTVPSLIALETLARAGCLESFPHHLNFICHLPERADAVDRLRTRVQAQPDFDPAAADVPATSVVMSPAVCYHFYKAHEHRRLDATVGATAACRCYRYEGRQTAGLRRLREFTMREAVFIGAPDRIEARVRDGVEIMKRLLEHCALESRIQTASDPFFLDLYDKKRLFQLSFDLKFEALARLPDDDGWLAVGSVNNHQDHFGKAFDIRLADGTTCHSCCIAFGLDRWCLAVLAQYGLEPRGWPAALRQSLEAGNRS